MEGRKLADFGKASWKNPRRFWALFCCPFTNDTSTPNGSCRILTQNLEGMRKKSFIKGERSPKTELHMLKKAIYKYLSN